MSRIGAAARIADSRSHSHRSRRFPVLGEACDVVGDTGAAPHGDARRKPLPAAAMLVLPPRDLVLQERRIVCPAKDGENQYLAILDGGPCYTVHPSDPAVALTALEAIVDVVVATDAGKFRWLNSISCRPSALDRETCSRPRVHVRYLFQVNPPEARSTITSSCNETPGISRS